MKSINNGNLNSIQQIQPDVLAQGRLDWIELISGLISVQFGLGMLFALVGYSFHECLEIKTAV